MRWATGIWKKRDSRTDLGDSCRLYRGAQRGTAVNGPAETLPDNDPVHQKKKPFSLCQV